MIKKALLIGINYKGTDNELNGCINDVYHIKTFLLSIGYQEENIKIITDEDVAISPTRKVILEEFEKLIIISEGVISDGSTSEGSTLFFSYSGHGSYIVDCSKVNSLKRIAYSNDELDGLDETICAVDGNIVDDELRHIVNKIPENSSLFALFDCCHSGTGLDLAYTISYENKQLTATFNPKTTLTRAEVVFISGCYDNQTSSDTVEDGEAQGALTWSFLKTMYKMGNSSKREIFIDMVTRLNKKYTQKPQISFGKTISIDDRFVL